MYLCEKKKNSIRRQYINFSLKYLATKPFIGDKIIFSLKMKILATKIVSLLNDIKILKIIGAEKIFITNNFIIGDQFFPHQKSENFGAIRKISWKIFSDKKNINNDEK